MPVLSPISLSPHKMNLIQTAAEGSQTIKSSQPAAIETPVAPEPVDPCHEKLTGLFTKENLSDDPANTVVDFVNQYCLEQAGFLNSKCSFFSLCTSHNVHRSTILIKLERMIFANFCRFLNRNHSAIFLFLLRNCPCWKTQSQTKAWHQRKASHSRLLLGYEVSAIQRTHGLHDWHP